MAKRATGVGKNKTSRSRKTAKRLAVKREKIVSRRSKSAKRTNKKRN